jgi:nucleoside-diphosphate kinase
MPAFWLTWSLRMAVASLISGVPTLMERTFVMFKPDCMERGLLGSILSRFERKGLRLVAMKMLRITPELARQHYAEHVEKPFYPGLEAFITASPVVGSVMEAPEVVRVVRDMLGATSGLKAAPGTIRGDHSASRQMNLVHASDSPESAAREIALYFKPEEIQQWDPTLACWLQAPDE